MQRGFTLIEALVAITILIFGALGPLAIAARGISDGLFAKNQITANYLAQQALEVFINRRDGNLNAPDYEDVWWLEGIQPCVNNPNQPPENNRFCQVDARSGNINSIGSQPSVPLAYCPAEGFYIDPAACPPGDTLGPVFERSIIVTKVAEDGPDNPTEINIIVTISWFNRAVPRSSTLVVHLYALD